MTKEVAMMRKICLTFLLLAAAGPALAHPGHGGSGFLHPFTGIDHLLVMVGVGLWASLLASRRPAMAILVAAAFPVMMGIGAIAGFAGIKLPLVEAVILASVFVLGGLLLGAVRLPIALATALVGLFAVFHGYAHALEAPDSAAGTYILGFMAATALLQGLGLGLGRMVLRRSGSLGLRALGGLMMAGGALVLITN
jgi:urease accessory protein